MRPSLVLAMACERAGAGERAVLDRVWSGAENRAAHRAEVARILEKLQVGEAARTLLKAYRGRALESLVPLENGNLKSVLHRVVWKIFNDTARMGCCNDYQAGHAPPGGKGEATAG
jgi:hypothetical protein